MCSECSSTWHEYTVAADKLLLIVRRQKLLGMRQDFGEIEPLEPASVLAQQHLANSLSKVKEHLRAHAGNGVCNGPAKRRSD